MKAIGIVLAAFASLALLDRVSGLKCYYCNSHYNASCEAENVPAQYEMDCADVQKAENSSRPYIMCRKIKISIKYNMPETKPTERVIRTCGWDDSKYKNKCYRRTATGEKQEVCSCETDLCNAARNVGPSLTLIATSALALFKLIL